MKTDQKTQCDFTDNENGFSQAQLRACPDLTAQIDQTKEGLLMESRALLTAPERTLRLALNEAEALAWQTPFPHLVFPVLAEEKVRRAEDWNRRQAVISAIALANPPAAPNGSPEPRYDDIRFSGLNPALGRRKPAEQLRRSAPGEQCIA